jgi:predicted nucleic acid-binding protein
MRLLGSMPRFEVGEQAAWRAATLMREYVRSHSGTGLGDYLTAATALTEGLELATLNVRHYRMLPGLTRPFPALPGPSRPFPALPGLKDRQPARSRRLGALLTAD